MFYLIHGLEIVFNLGNGYAYFQNIGNRFTFFSFSFFLKQWVYGLRCSRTTGFEVSQRSLVYIACQVLILMGSVQKHVI